MLLIWEQKWLFCNRILIKIFCSTGFIPEKINISTGTSLSLLEVAELVKNVTTKITGKAVNIVKEKTSETGYELTIENNSLREMGIIPSKTLVEEIKLMLDFLEYASWLAIY